MVPPIKQIVYTSTGERGETLLKLWSSKTRITYTLRWEYYRSLMATKNSEPL